MTKKIAVVGSMINSSEYFYLKIWKQDIPLNVMILLRKLETVIVMLL